MEGNKKASGALDILRKRLFIAAAYLLVVTGLLAYVTYGQYRIKISANVNMPTAATFEASIVLSPNEEEGRGWAEEDKDTDSHQLLLAGLMPSDDAMEYAKKEDANHHIELKVRNWYEEKSDGNDETPGTKVIAGVPLEYHIRINGTGCLPLEFVLVDEDGNKYQSKATTDGAKQRSYKFYLASEEGDKVTLSETEALFKIGKNKAGALDEVEKTMHIYVGWQSESDASSQSMAIKDFDSGAYRKEVERLEIRTVLTGEDVGHEILPEDTLLDTLEENQYALKYKAESAS